MVSRQSSVVSGSACARRSMPSRAERKSVKGVGTRSAACPDRRNSNAVRRGSQVIATRRPISFNGCGSPDTGVRQVRSANHRGPLLRRARALIFFALVAPSLRVAAGRHHSRHASDGASAGWPSDAAPPTAPPACRAALFAVALFATIRAWHHHIGFSDPSDRQVARVAVAVRTISARAVHRSGSLCGARSVAAAVEEVLSRQVYESESGTTRTVWPRAGR